MLWAEEELRHSPHRRDSISSAKCSYSRHTAGRNGKVLVPAQSLSANDMDKYLSARCEPYLRVQDPKGLVESGSVHLLFLCIQ